VAGVEEAVEVVVGVEVALTQEREDLEPRDGCSVPIQYAWAMRRYSLATSPL